MNKGKMFEQDFKASVPNDIYYYRFRDGTANFAGSKNENVRFQATNMCDCLLFRSGRLVFAELKCYPKKSIPFSSIRPNQLKQLSVIDVKGVSSGFMFNMRDYNETWWVNANILKEYINGADRKSIPLEFMRENGVLVEQQKLQTRYRYNISNFMDWACNF